MNSRETDSPPRRGGVAAPQAQTGWSFQVSYARPPRRFAPPLLFKEGNQDRRYSEGGTSYRLLLNAVSTLLDAASAISLSASACSKNPAETALAAAVFTAATYPSWFL